MTIMRHTIRTAVPAMLAIGLLASCSDDPGTATAESTDTPSQSATDGAGQEQIMTASSDLGTFLVDAEGRTLYIFTQDSPGTSVCEGECLEAWPALEGPVTAGEDVDDSLLGTTERADGSVQATYADWPLYYFAQDQAAGDVNGQGVNDVWYVIDPDGEVIESAPEPEADTGGY